MAKNPPKRKITGFDVSDTHFYIKQHLETKKCFKKLYAIKTF